jgi:hypothetical protein
MRVRCVDVQMTRSVRTAVGKVQSRRAIRIAAATTSTGGFRRRGRGGRRMRRRGMAERMEGTVRAHRGTIHVRGTSGASGGTGCTTRVRCPSFGVAVVVTAAGVVGVVLGLVWRHAAGREVGLAVLIEVHRMKPTRVVASGRRYIHHSTVYPNTTRQPEW